MKSCCLNRHPGVINFDSGVCVFYGIPFESILKAAEFLRGVQAGPEYRGKVVRGVKVLKDVELSMWLSEGRWWPDKHMAVKAAKRIV